MASGCLDHKHAGFKECHWNPVAGGWISIYVAAVAGIDRDPDQLYAVVCDSHGAQTSARSLTSAKILAADSAIWCPDCQVLSARKQN